MRDDESTELVELILTENQDQDIELKSKYPIIVEKKELNQ